MSPQAAPPQAGETRTAISWPIVAVKRAGLGRRDRADVGMRTAFSAAIATPSPAHAHVKGAMRTARVGGAPFVSRRFTLDRARVDAFAAVREDRQFIHVDPIAAKATPFGGTVAHGFLTLAMLSAMADDALPPVAGLALSVNCGFDRVRFLAPVKTGRESAACSRWPTRRGARMAAALRDDGRDRGLGQTGVGGAMADDACGGGVRRFAFGTDRGVIGRHSEATDNLTAYRRSTDQGRNHILL
jgi:acyl dehydratase